MSIVTNGTLSAGNTSIGGALSATGDIYGQQDIYTSAWQAWTSPATVGLSAAPALTEYVYYKKIGKLVVVAFYFSGESSATSFQFTLPFKTAPAMPAVVTPIKYTDSAGAGTESGTLVINSDTTQADMFINWDNGAWTASGLKRAQGQFFYEAAV